MTGVQTCALPIYRSARFVERESVQELAESEDPVLSVEEAAETIGIAPARLRALLEQAWAPGAVFSWTSGELRGVQRSSLGLLARLAGAKAVETA